MRMRRFRRIVAVALATWLPSVSMVHVGVLRCGAPAAAETAAGSAMHMHGHQGSHRHAPGDGQTCPCSSLGVCHCSAIATVAGGTPAVAAGPALRIIAAVRPRPAVRAPASRLLPFSTAPPLIPLA